MLPLGIALDSFPHQPLRKGLGTPSLVFIAIKTQSGDSIPHLMHITKQPQKGLLCNVLPLGIEPRSTDSKSVILSVERQEPFYALVITPELRRASSVRITLLVLPKPEHK